MGSRQNFVQIILLFFVLSSSTVDFIRALTERDFYPFGRNARDERLQFHDDVSSTEIQLSQPIILFGTPHSTCFVNQNGFISFGTELPYYANQKISNFQRDIIAVFYADVDTRIEETIDAGNGNVFYRQVTSDRRRLLSGASKLIQTNFKDAKDFRAKALLIATWDNVGYYSGKSDKRNSFQMVIASNDSTSYAAFLYGGIQWIQSDGKEMPLRSDIPAQAGFVTADGRHQTLVGSGSESMIEIPRLSNVNQAGLYVFRISGMDGPVDPRSLTLPQTDPEYIEYEDDDEETDYQPPPPPPPPAPPRNLPEEVENRVPNPVHSVSEGSVKDYEEEYYGNEEYYQYENCPPTDLESCPEDCQIAMDRNGCQLCFCAAEVGDSNEDSSSANENRTPEVAAASSAEDEAQPAPPLLRNENRNREEQVPPNPEVASGGGGDGATSCAAAGHATGCHAEATCKDYAHGYCCECNPGFYGNGKECLKDEEPQRINGRFSAEIGEKRIQTNDLHTYVVTSDGRAYTALSQIPSDLGPSLLLLDTIGGVMGWLFAKVTSPGAYNGFTLTGGLFNRTATVHIGDAHTVTIQQDFSGRDIYHYFKASVFVTGTLPEVPEGAEVEIAEYHEEYRRVGPGIVKSYSSRGVRVGRQPYHVTIDQTIRYQECSFKEFDKEPMVTLRVDRSYVVYDSAEQIVRYAAANTIQGAQRPGADPCQQGSHTCTGQNQLCVPEGGRYRCMCAQGYEMLFTNELNTAGTCVDIDECIRGSHNCDVNADCYNTDGAFACRCKAGYMGNGVQCTAETCDVANNCDPNADCVFEQTELGGGYTCKCRQGFTGDGTTCTALPSPQGATSCGGYTCHMDAECLPAARGGGEECVCKHGFYGNGLDCRPLATQPETTTKMEQIGPVCRAHEDCSPYGMCHWNEAVRHYQCICRPPYSGDGVHCFLEAETCDVANNCDPNADCVFEQTELGGGYTCRCRQGFTGDGLTCTPLPDVGENVECNVLNNCHPSAQCVYNNELGQHVCQCLVGYSGDGYNCVAQGGASGESRCRTQDDCHPSAHCIIPEHGGDYICECLPGFSGDGVTYCEPADECSPSDPQASCSPYASCMYRQEDRAYVCQCNPGYEGDGKVCNLPPPYESCDRNPSLCHQNAQCVYNQQFNNYECHCWTGYEGDGYTRCEKKEEGCDVLRNCHRDADCIQDSASGRYLCRCRFGYRGDGYTCSPEVTCYDNRDLCDENADCLPVDRTYECRCKPGYHGNGRTCTADSKQRGRTMVIAQGMTLIKRGLDADEMGKQLIIVPHQIAVGIAFDCQEEKLYWSDVSGHTIRSANLDGSNVTVIIESELSSPEGIAIDTSSRNIYYADSGKKEIGVVTMDGSYQATLISDGLVNPRALALNLLQRKIYYSDWHRSKPVIGKMALDGTEREEFVTEDISLPNSLVILSRRQELCWVDAGKQRLECINFNGQGRRVVHAPLSYPFGLAVRNEETFYWSDWEDSLIHSVSVYGGEHSSFAPSVGGSGKLYGIITIPEQCFQGQTECAEENGGCAYICLPRPNIGKSCICPDNVDAPDCNKLEELKKLW